MDKTIIGTITEQQKKTEQLTPYLRVQSPDNLTHRYKLSNRHITLGRGHGCDIVLDDEMVSREHCRIWLDSENKINILDLNSTNGSKIDSKKINHDILLPHNRLKIGLHIIKIEYKDAEEIRQDELLQTAATSDPLTGVSNRKWFEERVNQIIQSIDNFKGRGKKQYIAIVMVDIDHFKQVNDSYGHQTGDVVIKGVAEIINSCKRQQDLLARYGGEEFVVCLPDSTPENTIYFCERVRQEIEKKIFRFGKTQVKVTASFGGYSNTVEQNSKLSKMTAIADSALYQSKNSGRNRVTMAQE